MKSLEKYKSANKFIADAWYDSRLKSVHVDNLKRDIPRKRVADGRFILDLELKSKGSRLAAEIVQAEAAFEKLTFTGCKNLADVRDRSHRNTRRRAPL